MVAHVVLRCKGVKESDIQWVWPEKISSLQVWSMPPDVSKAQAWMLWKFFHHLRLGLPAVDLFSFATHVQILCTYASGVGTVPTLTWI